ncbi:Acg family FMN-binding oxidoreductase [Roseovarius salinarum]|uniref:Acg family FMN-binding oxidoreductase n=1 Tax=Roseovarius salinarum TaxID=1981892 RepID=UPI000C326A42|nr:nitroreductase family protein [Roseovarius salinarum]
MTADAEIRDLVNAAHMAPSSHNTQPWVFEVEGRRVRLLADRTRALPANDPDDRELTISCGAALLNLRAAAAAQGHGAQVALLPDADDPDLLAEVEIGPGTPETALAPLAPAIAARRTWRKPFDGTPVPADRVAQLQRAAQEEGAWLAPLEDPQLRESAAELVSEGDAAQWADPRWRRELAAWMHPRRDGEGLSLPWLAVPVAQLVVRSFDMGGGVAAHDAKLAEGSPLLAVLGTGADGTADWLRAGQALERVLLAGAADGVQASYLNQPVQVAHLRPKLQALAAQPGQPQILLRMGFPEDEVPAAPRRPLDAVLQG